MDSLRELDDVESLVFIAIIEIAKNTNAKVKTEVTRRPMMGPFLAALRAFF